MLTSPPKAATLIASILHSTNSNGDRVVRSSSHPDDDAWVVAISFNQDLDLRGLAIAVVLVPHEHAQPISGIKQRGARLIVCRAPPVDTKRLKSGDTVRLKRVRHRHA